MYSMKRISRPCCRANRASGTTSASVTPRMLTALILIGSKARLLRGGDAGEHLLQAVAAGDLAEARRVERVEADVDAAQAGVEQGLGLLGEQEAVGGQADVADAGDLDQHPHQPRQVAAHQRLAAGQADLVDAQRRRHADEVGDLLEGEQLGPVHEDDFLRHAVGAAEVAAIGDADAQVVVDAAEGIDEWRVANGEWRVGRIASVRIASGISSLISVPLLGWTHSVLPSAQFSFFQMGTSSLSRSMA